MCPPLHSHEPLGPPVCSISVADDEMHWMRLGGGFWHPVISAHNNESLPDSEFCTLQVSSALLGTLAAAALPHFHSQTVERAELCPAFQITISFFLS